jgi:cell pole-organizing protein PopZ
MSTAFSVAEVLARLEARIAHHEQQMALHQQQEAHHREQSAAHAAELETVRRHFESFKATALPAADLAGVSMDPGPAREETPEDLREFVGKRIMASKLIARVIQRLGDDEAFGASRVAEEANRRFRDSLKKPVDTRMVSVVLRRLRDSGELHQVRSGGAAHEALYSKRRPG